MLRAALIAAVMTCLCTTSAFAQRTANIRGRVVDADSMLPLRFARVAVLETRTATMTDKQGAFLVRFPAPAADSVRTLVVSLIGYEPDTIRVGATDTNVVFPLRIRPFTGRMVTVVAEDPAVRIMRKVLERKRIQRDTLTSYTYMLYTKFVANTDTATASRSTGRGDTTVLSILESFSKGYFQKPDKYFNEILQRRQTANIPAQANFVSFGTNLNAYDNDVTILNEQIETPFSLDALDHYEFTLLSDEETDTVVITAKSVNNSRKAFEGTLFVDQRKAIPVEARLVPNKAVNLPFDASLQYRQSFVEVSGVVLPEGLTLQSSLQAAILFLFEPRLDVSIETFCYDYAVNPEIERDIFEQRRVEISPQAYEFDSTFWRLNQKLPLRVEEEQAYVDIQNIIDNPDSLQTSFLDSYIGPVTRFLAQLGRRPFSGFEDVFRYNRVHGAYFGLGSRFRPDTVMEIEAGIGYGTMDNRLYYWLHPTVFFGARQNWSVDASYQHILQRRDNANVVRTGLISFTSLLFGNDYGDYYYRTGGELGFTYAWGQLRFIRNDFWARPSSIRLFVRSEGHNTAEFRDVWSLMTSDRNNRENPAIFNGNVRTLGATLTLNYSPIRLINRTGMWASVEMSNPDILPSDFHFGKAQWLGVARMRTLPLWTLDVVATAGWSWGNVPPQYFSSLESSVSGLVVGSVFRGMNVKEFYGDRYATLSLSHNFGEVIPGLLRIPDIASFGIEFLLFGGVGWTTFTDATRVYTQTVLPTTDRAEGNTYYEVGLGINRILLFFRLDVNARISQRTIPEIRVTLSGATF